MLQYMTWMGSLGVAGVMKCLQNVCYGKGMRVKILDLLSVVRKLLLNVPYLGIIRTVNNFIVINDV